MAKTISDEYMKRKITNCDKLIETATSPEQKEAYRDFREFWMKKAGGDPVKIKEVNEVFPAPKSDFVEKFPHLNKVIEEIIEEPAGVIEPIIEETIEEPKSTTTATTEKPLIEEFIEKPVDEPTIEDVIIGKTEIANNMIDIAAKLTEETEKISYICQKGWNDEFEALFPKKAIWQGQITQAFSDWLLKEKLYE